MAYDRRGADRYDEAHEGAFAEAEAIAAALAHLRADAAPDLPALELGIGTGRLALPLAHLGVEVHGIDSSEPMVGRLRAKPGGADLRVWVGDFTDVGDLVEGHRYAIVYVAFNTLFELPTQDAQLKCLTGVATVLSPGGVLVVECLAPDLTRLEQTLSVLRLGSDGLTLQATSHDPLTQQVRGHDVVVTEGDVTLEPWTIRYASVPELDLMARLAGLRLRQRWGGWHREPFTAASTRHVSTYVAEEARARAAP